MQGFMIEKIRLIGASGWLLKRTPKPSFTKESRKIKVKKLAKSN